MNMNEYQKRAWETGIYPDKGRNIIYPILGLTGESGEVAEHGKKILRDDGGLLTDERREKMIKELGDVLWYVAAVASELGVSLDTVAQTNLDKLATRKSSGTLQGSGSDR